MSSEIEPFRNPGTRRNKMFKDIIKLSKRHIDVILDIAVLPSDKKNVNYI